MRSRVCLVVAFAFGLVVALAPGAAAPHFYRGPGGGCTPADGALTDDDSSAEVVTTVYVMHNTFHDERNLSPLTMIEAGDTVRWAWNSSHCHSVREQVAAPTFYSGYHYPTAEPVSPHVVPGFLDFPVPDLEPSLSYTHTFRTPGMFMYSCEHHSVIGMVGFVIVE